MGKRDVLYVFVGYHGPLVMRRSQISLKVNIK